MRRDDDFVISNENTQYINTEKQKHNKDEEMSEEDVKRLQKALRSLYSLTKSN